MANPTLLIIGGGLAGLSTGIHALRNGWHPVIYEHGMSLGGVCQAWNRGAYTIDGCIQWLMGAMPGGWFREVFEEVGAVPAVELRPIDLYTRFEHFDGWAIDIGRDLDRLEADLIALAPGDANAIRSLFADVRSLAELRMPLDAPEVTSLADRLRFLWEARHLARPLVHLRGSVGAWCEHSLADARVREVLTTILPADMPMMFLAVFLAQLGAGQLARPVGGTERFRDAIVDRYLSLGGVAHTNATVDEILIEREAHRAYGLRLADGTEVRGDHVVSTTSAHDTYHHLLGGRVYDRDLEDRLEHWRTFDPIVLVSAGIADPLEGVPAMLAVRQREPIDLGGPVNDTLRIRVYNDEPSVAPPGHTVVQAALVTSWSRWASAGSRYQDEKQRVADLVIDRIAHRLPAIRGAVTVTDISTPLTYWRYARAWRGAYEGWYPTAQVAREHPAKTVGHLRGLHLAGQWVEPGGGVPTALWSGRQVIQILCDELGHRFVAA